MDEIIKHDEGQVPVKVKLASLPSVAQANVNLFDFEDNLQQCLYDMRDIVTHKAYRCIYQERAYFLSMEIMKTKRNSGFSSSPKVPYKEKSTHESFVSA